MMFDSYLEQVKTALWGHLVSEESFTERDMQMHMMQMLFLIMNRQ